MFNMKVFIPLNGKGDRFFKKGYTDYKPFIKILGEDIIKRVISSIDIQNELIILARKEFKNYNLEFYLYKNFPHIKSKVIYLEQETMGAAETLHTGLTQYYKDNFIDEPFLSLDGDTIYHEPIIHKITEKENNAIFYTHTNEQEPIYSYIKLNSNNEVTDIAEKIKISNLANTGAYYFNSTADFLNAYITVVSKNSPKTNNEYYISDIYKELLKQNKKIKGIKIEKLSVVGTPIQLQNYCLNNTLTTKKRFVFDLDNTLVSYPTVKDDYTTVIPIQKNIDFLNYLKNNGHYIIIYTARRMKTHNGNTSKVVADIGEITLKTLKDFNINYDEIQFGKPYADFYIDDLSINPLKENLLFSTGYYFLENIETRPFNNITIQDNVVTKTGNVKGECYWYNNVPYYILKKYFPPIINISEEKLIFEKIEGISFSHLYVNNLLTENIFKKLFSSLEEIHEYNEPKKGNFIKNYLPKIEKRYTENKTLYDQLPNANTIFRELKEFFYHYKPEQGYIIHGDPVFSNIFLTTNNTIKFIDVKGINLNEYSIFGDPLYDYAKIYQSVLGYDFILLNKDIDQEIIKNNKLVFEKLVTNKNLNFDTIKIITKSLLFSLVPLHNDFNKVQQYYQLIGTV